MNDPRRPVTELKVIHNVPRRGMRSITGALITLFGKELNQALAKRQLRVVPPSVPPEQPPGGPGL